MDIRQLAQEIIDGRRLTGNDDLSVFEKADIEELAEGADLIRQKLCGDNVELCTIINGRAGRCSEDCRFCAQSSHNHTGCEVHGMLSPEEVLEDCKKREAAGVHAYSIVTAGRSIEGEALNILVETYALLHRECDMVLCASHGLITEEAFRRLKEAGVTRYHANIETSERNFSNICTTHSYADKIKEIRLAKAAGMVVCSGGIIGMGETWQDRLDMAVALAKLAVDSIPINALIPVKGTPFGDLPRLTEDEIIRTVAMFRYINPKAFIRMAAGRNYFADGGRRLFKAGVNAAISGDMLTTVGNNTRQDVEMLKDMGFEL